MENVENKTEEKEIEPYDFDYWQDYFENMLIHQAEGESYV